MDVIGLSRAGRKSVTEIRKRQKIETAFTGGLRMECVLLNSYRSSMPGCNVAATMRIAPPLLRLDDPDIISYPWLKPVWIAERIVCLVIAVECIRFVDERPALFPKVGPVGARSGVRIGA